MRNLKKSICLASVLFSPIAYSTTQPVSCDRACLLGITNQYLEALTAHDPTKVRIDPRVRATENALPTKLGEGLWKTATGLGTYRIYAQDTTAQQAAFIGVVYEQKSATTLVVRLKVAGKTIKEIETIVTRNGFPGPAGLAPARLSISRGGFQEEVDTAGRLNRSTLKTIANSYYDGIETGSPVPFADDCRRIENGEPVNHNPQFDFGIVSADGKKLPNFGAMSCAEQFDERLWSTDTITKRRFPIVDVQRGLVLVIASYNVFAKGQCAQSAHFGRLCPPQGVPPLSLDMAELFHIDHQQIHEIESTWTAVPYLTPTGW